MRLETEEARRRLAAARVLRLATADGEGRPHLVPVTFALGAAPDAESGHEGPVGPEGQGGHEGHDGYDGRDTVVIAVDHKPKRHQDLKRLRNIRANSAVCLLADHYDEDWRHLWWVRADGVARVLDGPEERAGPVRRLCAKYPQYAEQPPQGPVVAVGIDRWTGWSFAG